MLSRSVITKFAGARQMAVAAKKLTFPKVGAPSNVLKYEDVSVPEKAEGDEVIVKMVAAPINPSDINTIQGVYPVPNNSELVPGHEGVAKVLSVGPKAKGFKAGDLVIPAVAGFGTWRTHAVVPAAALALAPAGLDPIKAAVMTVNPLTAHRLLSDFENLVEGDVVVQNAGNSAVGQAVIQLAKARGITTVSLIRDRPDQEEVVEHLKALGGDVVVSEGDISSGVVSKVFDDLPAAKLGLDCVGGNSTIQVARLLRNDSTLVNFGCMSKKAVSVPASALIFKNITLKGFWLSKWKQTASAEDVSSSMAAVAESLKSGDLKVLVKKVPFAQGLDEIKAAATSRYSSRKAVLTFE